MISVSIFAAALATTPATAPAAPIARPGARQQARIVMPENERMRQVQDSIGWASAIVSNDIVYVSGVPAFLAPGETDREAAYERAFVAIGKTLERAGVSWNDVVSMTTYHTDPVAQIEGFAKVKARHVKAPHPAWSAIGTNALLQPGGLVEISVIAHVPRKKQP